MSETTKGPPAKMEHEYCIECGDFIRYDFRCSEGCSEDRVDVTKRKRMGVATYTLTCTEIAARSARI